MEQELFMTRLYLVDDLTQSVWNVCGTLKTICSRKQQFYSKCKTVLREKHVNRESNCSEITV